MLLFLLLSSSWLSSQSFYSSEILLCGSVWPLWKFSRQTILSSLKIGVNNKKQIFKESLKSHDNLSRAISRGKQKGLVLFALLTYSFPHSLPFLMPLWFSEKCIFLVLTMYFPLSSFPACEKKPSVSQDLLTWTLAPTFWKWNLINCCRKNGMGMFLISFPHEATSHPVLSNCSWDSCSFLFIHLIYLLILLEMEIPGSGTFSSLC